jgi:molecular chaperone DnaJ
VTVRVRPHPYFRRLGDDVHTEVPVTLAEAVLGAEIEVATIDGPVRVRLPAGTRGGQRFRLRHRGVKPPRGGEPGNHHFTVEIELPSRLDAATRELLARLSQGNPRDELDTEL